MSEEDVDAILSIFVWLAVIGVVALAFEVMA